MHMKNKGILGVLWFVFFFSIQTLIFACPNCKDGFSAETNHSTTGDAYSWTIYLMILMPIVLIGIVVSKIVSSIRQNEMKKALASTATFEAKRA